jgi:hypothetical protein
MSYIFISYSKKNHQYAYPLAEFLQEQGFDVWIDKIGIEYGVNWWKAIVKGVRGCGAMLVLMTPESEASEWVEKEVFIGLELKKPMFPLLLNGNRWDLFITTQYIDVSAFTMPDTDFLKQIGKHVTPKKQIGRNQSPVTEQDRTNTAFSMDDAIGLFTQAFRAKDWAQSLEILGQMRASGEDPSPIDPDYYEDKVRTALKMANCERVYQRLLKVAEITEPHQLLNSLELIWKECPDYDPQGLAAQTQQAIAKITPPSAKSAITDSSKGIPAKHSKVPAILPSPFEWITIPTGKVTLETRQTYDVPTFQIAKYPVTNAQYQVFVEAKDGYTDVKWWDFLKEALEWRKGNAKSLDTRFKGDDLPRTNVTWYDCIAFCRWLSAKVDENISLPTEQQWQRAAQGNDGREYPWGNGFDKSRANTSESGIRQVTPVTQYLNGASPFGVIDMAGNVWEWCLSDYGNPSSISINANSGYSLRGGSWKNFQDMAHSAYRNGIYPLYRFSNFGFRVCLLS